MRKALALVVSLPLVACVVGDGSDTGSTGGGGGGGGSGSGSGSDTGGGTGISGRIDVDTMWSGAVLIAGITTIDPGVTVIVEAGATITMKGTAALQINGILDAQGTAAAKITITPETAGFNGVVINAGGELRYKYVDQTGGGITTSGTGKATIIDSHLSKTAGDFLMMSGGTLDVQYSAIGLEPGMQDTTHCNMHFGGTGNVIKVTHSNISTSSYGLMFYGGMSADFTYNNWFENTVDIATQTGTPVSGDFSNGWFQKPAPTLTGITANNLAGARLVACTGTNDTLCAGLRP